MDRREYLKYGGVIGTLPFLSKRHRARPDERNDHGREPDSEPIVPIDLRVEYAETSNTVSPTTGDSADRGFEVPRFSWTIAGPRGTEQSAYRVRVAERWDALDDTEGGVWDSGVVQSSRSVYVPYDGSPLEPDTTYHWKVRLWDGEGDE
ncbi:glycoside hydrolase family 78 protein [Natrialba asiatica]|uniref:glycoside hydrolase family 78 protein n=1 Tax=Natrialba asiatica TaxID=64602 RepID=UPI000B1C3462|nr:hypothetical protein [Natrialba asiatica]